MLKTKEFKGTIVEPDVSDKINAFIKDISLNPNQIIDIKYNTNLLNIKKTDGSNDMILFGSALLIYED